MQYQHVFVDTRLLFVQRQTFCFNTKLLFVLKVVCSSAILKFEKKKIKNLFKSSRPEVFCKKKVSQKFCKTDRKKPVSEFLQKALLKKR